MTNPPYAQELAALREYQGFGGDQEIDLADHSSYKGFIWAAFLLKNYFASGSSDPIDYAFRILETLEWDNNQWAVVYDIRNQRMFFRTVQADKTRLIDFSSFDFSCDSPPMMLDINRDLQGDVASYFEPSSEKLNKQFVQAAVEPIDLQVKPEFVAKIFKYFWRERLNHYTSNFTCSP
jgi:hypothetical protein